MGIRKTHQAQFASLFNCSNMDGFLSTVVRSLPYHGVSASKFFHCEFNNIPFLTKMCFYKLSAPEIYLDPKSSAFKEYMSHTDAEIKILIQLRDEIIRTGISPCVLEIVYFKICDDVKNMLPSGQMCSKITSGEMAVNTTRDDFMYALCEYYDMVKNGLAKNKVAFVVLERCDITFETYIRRGINADINFTIFTTMLFMVIYTVHAITAKFPNFLHYDLHTENVMIKYDKGFAFDFNHPTFLEFRVDDSHVFYIPYFGMLPKIIDFGFSSNPHLGTESIIVVDKWQMFKRTGHDLLYFFHWVYAGSTNIDWDPQNRIGKLLSQLEPTRSYMYHYPEAIKKNTKINTPLQMLMSDPFKQFTLRRPHDSSIQKKFSVVGNLHNSK